MTSLRLPRTSVIAAGFLIALFATTPADAALIDNADATGAPPAVQLQRDPSTGQDMTVAWWFRPSCWRRRMPNCPNGAAYVSGQDSCGPIWSCGQSYIPNNSRPDTWNAPSPPPGWFDR